MKLLLASVIAASTLAACAATVRATCEEPGMNPPAALTCEQAIAAARAEFVGTLGITKLVVDYGDCPPAGRGCQLGAGRSAMVLAVLADGRGLSVSVSIDPDGVIRSEAPVMMPAPGAVIGRIAHMFDSSAHR